MSEDDSYDSNQSQDLKKVILSEICVEIFQLQWNLDLRKILGVIKIFLELRFFLISNMK